MAREARPLVFLGTPDAAASVLLALHGSGFSVEHVITRPDARRGRGGATSASPVKRTALDLGIDVSHDLGWFDAHGRTDALGIVVAYGRIIPADLLARVPMINVHFSLLPRWRGAAPVERAILAGDTTTGVCIMDLEETLDTGPVHGSREVTIRDDHTTSSLTSELAEVGAQLLIDVLTAGLSTPVPQSGTPTYAHKIDPSENRIDWSMSATEIDRHVRALRGYSIVDGVRIKILSARIAPGSSTPGAVPGSCDMEGCVATGTGMIVLDAVQPEGKRAMQAQEWLRGRSGPAILV